MSSKVCCVCGETKDIQYFKKNKKLSSGYDHICLECNNSNRREYYYRIRGREPKNDRLNRSFWTEKEKLIIKDNYSELKKEEILKLIPNRSWSSIVHVANRLGLSKTIKYHPPLTEETKRKISLSNKGRKMSEETKIKLYKSHKGKHPSEETRKKLSLRLKGNKYSLGYKHTEEWKIQMSKNQKGHIKSEETCKKISEGKRGKKHGPQSKEWREKISLANKGRVISEETRRRLSLSNKGKIPWSKGLTKETNKSLMSTSQKIKNRPVSEETRKKISESKMGHLVSEDTREKISKKTKERYDNDPKVRERLIGFSKSKDNVERLCRIVKPSKTQLRLFEIIKKIYPDNNVEVEWKVKTISSVRSIDVAIPELMLGFEYDEPYWHKDKEKDKRRHTEIEGEGWRLEHYTNESEFPKYRCVF